MNSFIEALKERLDDVFVPQDNDADELYNDAIDNCIHALDTFQSERQWHDPKDKLPGHGQAVWVWPYSGAPKYMRHLTWYPDKDRFEKDNGWPFDVSSVYRWTERYVDEAPPLPEESNNDKGH